MTREAARTYVTCERCGQTNKVAVKTTKTPVCGACKAELPVHEAIVTGTDHSLATLIAKSPLPVVIDVWAPWCVPCRSFAPTFERASLEFAGQFVFAKINSEENPRLPGQWGVRGIPTLILFHRGREVDRVSGALPSDDFTRWLKSQALSGH